MRQVSLSELRGLLAQQTDAVYLPAIDVSHDSLITELHWVCNTESVTCGGTLYSPAVFRLKLGADNDEQVPVAQLEFTDIDRTMIEFLRSISTPPTVHYSVLCVLGTGTVSRMLGPVPSTLLHVANVDGVITGTLGVNRDILNEPAVSVVFTPSQFPGLF